MYASVCVSEFNLYIFFFLLILLINKIQFEIISNSNTNNLFKNVTV